MNYETVSVVRGSFSRGKKLRTLEISGEQTVSEYAIQSS